MNINASNYVKILWYELNTGIKTASKMSKFHFTFTSLHSKKKKKST